uniref:DNA-directed RNA polymerase subunit beta n=1 Tax=Palmophyllum crassum TaxID=1615899 RepID=A0A1L7NY14_9VIRI|nr:beta subunit of RNA polymerase [Palmophyllum crassum]BAW34809.1 beta subunit of RNA polymerase [Palmophyllum crassum]
MRLKKNIQNYLPDLTEIQRKSYFWFLKKGIKEEFEKFSIIELRNVRILIHAENYKLKLYKNSLKLKQKINSNYSSQIIIPITLINKKNNSKKIKKVIFGDLPLLTNRGQFYINGISRVVINQIIRSPGVYFEIQIDLQGQKRYVASFISNRGSWFKLETDKQGFIWAHMDRKSSLPAIILLKALGFSTQSFLSYLDFPNYLINQLNEMALSTNQKVLQIYSDYHLDKIYNLSQNLSLLLVHKYFRPEKLSNLSSAKLFIYLRFLDFKNYDLGFVGRSQLNKKFNLKINKTIKNLTPYDLLATFNGLINLCLDYGKVDDIDHLKNRRIHSIGELLQNQLRIGLTRLEKFIKDKFFNKKMENIDPNKLININIIQIAFKEFFGSNPLSQFLHQTNTLSEITHKRRLSCLGPGGLSRDRTSFLVRDIHLSHYGRICPIETPEGPNAGLINSLATYARTNKYGFLESPFFDSEKKINYFSADEDANYKIASADILLDLNKIKTLPIRAEENFIKCLNQDVEYQAISTIQQVSIATCLIPFLEHNDANRALMGSNMQRQAIPLLFPKRSRIGTGLETQVALDSENQLIATTEGIVIYVDCIKIKIFTPNFNKSFLKIYNLENYQRTNQNTSFHQRPQVNCGEWINKGDLLANGGATASGDLALGQDVLIAYMPWEGYNFEDALLISERLVYEDYYTSVHIEKIEVEIRQTKFGSEWLTSQIPTLSKFLLRHLDKNGLVKIGSWVEPNDILVGKVTPNTRKERDQSPERYILQDIFGVDFHHVRATCLKVPPEIKGRVIDVRLLNKTDFSSGVIKKIQIFIAQNKKLQVGDKMSGRHGNKGIVSTILPRSDMPYLPNGTPIDMVLNPLGIPSRMNVGQVYECLLGFAASILNQNYKLLGFDERYGFHTSKKFVYQKLLESKNKTHENWLFNPKNPGKMQLFDGRTGKPFDQLILVGKAHILKLDHLVDHKIHARSTGPYSLVTQQPLGGRSKHGGQRFGEMEVWALEGYGAAYTLQELLTVKSDDIEGRNKTFNAIVKGYSIPKPGTPEAFKVLIRELHSLCLDINIFK